MTHFTTPRVGEEMLKIQSPINQTFGQQSGSGWKTFSFFFSHLAITLNNNLTLPLSFTLGYSISLNREAKFAV